LASDVIRLGSVTIEVSNGHTVTTLPNAAIVTADHAEQPGQAELARSLGYGSAEEMNREHDISHSIIAHLLRLECSPTLLGVASGKTYRHWPIEEQAVLRLQGFARAVGVDLIEVAKRIGQ
jgi:hypothetical protein